MGHVVPDDLAERLPGMLDAIFEASAHMAMVEEPDRYREVLETFLERIEAT